MDNKIMYNLKQRRSRKGAWIEIVPAKLRPVGQAVAPVRERGLKYGCGCHHLPFRPGRSRKGAWIEIFLIC